MTVQAVAAVLKDIDSLATNEGGTRVKRTTVQLVCHQVLVTLLSTAAPRRRHGQQVDRRALAVRGPVSL